MASVGLIGFTVAVYYPCIVSFISEWTKMSGKYMGVFAIGQACGAMVTPIVNSYLMELRFDSFVTTTMLCQLLCSISFLLIWFVGTEIKVKTQNVHNQKPLLS